MSAADVQVAADFVDVTRRADGAAGERAEQPFIARVQLASAFRRIFAGWRRNSSEALSTSEPHEQAEDIETGRLVTSGEQGTSTTGHAAVSTSSRRQGRLEDAADGLIATPSSSPHADHQENEGSSPGESSASGKGEGAGSSLREKLARVISSGSSRMSRSGSANGPPTCLICLEPLQPQDFESGEAIALECACRGDVALRHHTCAVKWARVKGDNICDICKSPIRNLPAITPRADSEAGSDVDITVFDEFSGTHHHGVSPYEQMPGSADMIFDCIRVTWVAMIICILFFEMDLSSALWSGVVVGLCYTLFVRAMYRSQLAAAQAELLQRQQAAAVQPDYNQVAS